MKTEPQLAWGEVRHARLRPVANAFAYPTAFVLLPMRWLREQASSGWPSPITQSFKRGLAPLAFRHQDHGSGGSDALAWFDALLATAGIHDATGEVWLQTYPRMWGFAFKPVSFWYAHRADGSLRAVLAEVNNTFGERHAYLLHGPELGWGQTLTARKVFHVSPFCHTRGEYRFRFAMRSGEGTSAGADAGASRRLVARVELHDEQGPLLVTSVSGALGPWSAARAWATVARLPLLTLGVVARIHWQALKLWLKRVPFVRKPAPPEQVVSPALQELR